MTKRKKNLFREWKEKYLGLSVVVGVILLICVVVYGVNQLTQGGITIPDYTTTTLPFDCGYSCVTHGNWSASKLLHDTGHLAVDGSWESDADSFGYLCAANYIQLKKGSYDVTFEVKTDTLGSQNVGNIEVAQERGNPIVSRMLTGNDFNQAGEYQKYTLSFTTDHDLKDVETRVHYNKFGGKTNIRQIYLTPNS